MDIEFVNCKITEEKIEVTGKFCVLISELQHSSYSRQELKDAIFRSITEKMAEEYLKENKMKITEQIDLKKIIDGTQLKIIEKFSLNKIEI